jgi:hypothetical protein
LQSQTNLKDTREQQQPIPGAADSSGRRIRAQDYQRSELKPHETREGEGSLEGQRRLILSVKTGVFRAAE